MRTTPSILTKIALRVRNRHLFVADLLLVFMAAVLAFALRLDPAQLQVYAQTMLIFAIAAPIIKLPIFAGLGLYSRFWQYAGQEEMMLLVWAAAIGGVGAGRAVPRRAGILSRPAFSRACRGRSR